MKQYLKRARGPATGMAEFTIQQVRFWTASGHRDRKVDIATGRLCDCPRHQAKDAHPRDGEASERGGINRLQLRKVWPHQCLLFNSTQWQSNHSMCRRLLR